ncbi:809_t:CDS:2, partial [Diversispora eburnea]
YNVLIRDGYMHWKEEKVLVPPIHEKLTLGKWFIFMSNRFWDIAYNRGKSLLSLIDGKTSLLQVLLEHRPNALYDTFIKSNALGPDYILALAQAL